MRTTKERTSSKEPPAATTRCAAEVSSHARRPSNKCSVPRYPCRSARHCASAASTVLRKTGGHDSFTRRSSHVTARSIPGRYTGSRECFTANADEQGERPIGEQVVDRIEQQ